MAKRGAVVSWVVKDFNDGTYYSAVLFDPWRPAPADALRFADLAQARAMAAAYNAEAGCKARVLRRTRRPK